MAFITILGSGKTVKNYFSLLGVIVPDIPGFLAARLVLVGADALLG